LYMLRELLSQTNDLQAYCYLTDGGHFDNTGLYALVERGCRSIVLADCGSDPTSSFRDLGEAIRRCRIDFGTEIDIDLIAAGASGRHFLEGNITYAGNHLIRLGWDASDQVAKSGRLIIVKPTVAGDDPADIRGYKQQDGAFPQQTTLDQFFDEG